MKQVTFSIAAWDDVASRMVAAMDGEEQGAHISFATPELLWGTLTLDRWTLLSLLTGRAPLSVVEIAEEIGRDADTVEADLTALAMAGVVDRRDDGKVHFPYDAVHVDFVLKRAA